MKIDEFNYVVERILSSPDIFLVKLLKCLEVNHFNELTAESKKTFSISKENVLQVIKFLVISEFESSIVDGVESWACFVKYGSPVKWEPTVDVFKINYSRLNILRWDDDDFADIFSSLEDMQDIDSKLNLTEYLRHNN